MIPTTEGPLMGARSRRLVLVCAVLLGLTFFVLAERAEDQGEGQPWFTVDLATKSFVQNARSPALERPMHLLSHFGTASGLIPLGLTALLVLWNKRRSLALFVPSIPLGAVAIEGVSKWLVHRPRPNLTGYGFPSGHVLAAVTFYGALVYVCWAVAIHPPWQWVASGACVVAILGIAVSRIYLDAHWLTDVLGALVGGTAYLLTVLLWIDSRTRPGKADAADPVFREQRMPALRYQDVAVARAYDRQRFRGLAGWYHNWRLRRLLNQAVQRLGPGNRVLDLPCGTGRIDGWLLRGSLQVVAADISKEMLDVARAKNPSVPSRLRFVRVDASGLPFRSASVDAVICIRFIHLLDRETRLSVLAELARVAKQCVVVECRIERRVKTIKRAVRRWLRQPHRPRTKITLAEIASEMWECGLLAEDYYFVNRWFSGSVLIVAGRDPVPGASTTPKSV